MAKIVLIGTRHTDYKGAERLEKILKQYQPGIICLEWTPKEATEVWRNHCESVKKFNSIPLGEKYSQQQIEIIKKALFVVGYTVWVPKEYKNGSVVELFCIDRNNGTLQEELETKARDFLRNGGDPKELDEPGFEKIESLIEEGFENAQARIDALYRSDEVYSKLVKIYGKKLADKVTRERDIHFGADIDRLATRNPDKTIAVVIGTGHIFGDYFPNLFDLLSQYNPERIRLVDADLIESPAPTPRL